MTELIDFFEKFFENLECAIQRENGCLLISNVPAGFEKFSGKKSPYYFSFSDKKEGYEFVDSGHYFIKMIKEFLDGRGETTLLKMNAEFDPKEELPKLIQFRNCKIKSVTKIVQNDFIFRFSFASIFQYLNEKEQLINHIYLKDSEEINFNENAHLSEGNKKELKEINVEENYETAKIKLKKLIEWRVSEISRKLNEQLNKEISRIKEHYKNRLDEINQQKEILVRQIKDSDGEKKKKIEKMLQKIEEENPQLAEEQALIDGEKKKHSLSIKNKLINASVIYFPIFDMNLMLESGKTNRIINLKYDSLEKEISSLFCSSCNSKLDEIILCSSGHLTCRNCGDKCEICGGIFCKSCPQNECSYCRRKICVHCAEVCDSCKKTFCRNHIHLVGRKKLCHGCMQKCNKCGEIIGQDEIKKIDGKTFCARCFNQKNRKQFMKSIFE